MPELPEVETVRRGLDPVMAGRVIDRIVINRHDLRGGVPTDMAARFAGVRITALERRGKFIQIHGDNGYSQILHLGMSGRVRIITPGDADTPQKHDHVVWHTDQGVQVIFNDARRFGSLTYCKTDALMRTKPFDRMGPEPLPDTWTGDVLFDTLQTRTRVHIKAALLNQHIVAGVGNIYACEALYRARISPFAIAASLTRDQAHDLVHAIKAVLREAIAAGGSTLRDHAQTDGSMGYFQHAFDVYDRAGQTCGHCDAPCIERVVQNGRSTFYCTNLQANA